jgi:hypothetical protein
MTNELKARRFPMDPLNQALFQILKYIRYPLVPGEPIEVLKIIDRLQELQLLSDEEVRHIHEVMA